MTKADLVAAMAKAAGGSKVSAERALDAFFVSVFDALKKGRRVTIGGFGTFMVSKRIARDSRDPRTGQVIRIPATRGPRINPGRSLMAAVLWSRPGGECACDG